MKNILTILRNDLRSVRNNVMTAIILFGIAIIPLLFTAFNVLASWDPFGNTDQLEIAVASDDEGYESDLAPLELNLGDEVLSQLSRNENIDWVLTNTDDAIEGTRSGEYYAGIVLPPDFSQDLLTFYFEGTEPTKLQLYTNEKKNALSTTITQQGAMGVVQSIDESFTQVVASVGIGAVSNLEDFLNDDETQSAFGTIEQRMDTTATRLNGASDTVRSLSSLLDGTIPLAQAADNILTAAGNQTADSNVPEVDNTVSGSTGSLGGALEATVGSYSAVEDELSELLDRADATRSQAAESYRSAAERVDQQTAAMRELRDAVNSQADNTALPGPARSALAGFNAQLDAAIGQSDALHTALSDAADDIASGQRNSADAASDSRNALAEARQAVENARTNFEQDVQPQLQELGRNVGIVADGIRSVKGEVDQLRAMLDTGDGSSLVTMRDAANGLADELQEQARDFQELQVQVAEARDTGDLSQLADIVGNDPELLASRLSAPVAVDREPVYEVSSFGVGMAPFYATLALWIGALIASVLMKTNVEDEYLGEDSDFTRNQAYLGRYATMALLGLAQSTFLVLCLIFFLEINPAHPFLLMGATWVISLVFMLIIYTLVISFDSAGKAISVLLLVFQVSSAGGAYPLPLLPEWFQSISPWLPATYAIDALRSAIAGVYEGDIFKNLGMLLLFTIPILILGLWGRRLLDSYINRVQTGMAKTGVMQ